MIATEGQSIGKKAPGIKIIDPHTGKKTDLLQSVILKESVVKGIGWLPAVGAMYIIRDAISIFSTNRQTIHDRIGGTIVVDDSCTEKTS
jgi:uncharacterized RDD family membrane protein YckC